MFSQNQLTRTRGVTLVQKIFIAADIGNVESAMQESLVELVIVFKS